MPRNQPARKSVQTQTRKHELRIITNIRNENTRRTRKHQAETWIHNPNCVIRNNTCVLSLKNVFPENQKTQNWSTNAVEQGYKVARNQKEKKKFEKLRSKHLRETWRLAGGALGWSHRGPWWWCCHQFPRPIQDCRTGGRGPRLKPSCPSLPSPPGTPVMASPTSLRLQPPLVLRPLDSVERNRVLICAGESDTESPCVWI